MAKRRGVKLRGDPWGSIDGQATCSRQGRCAAASAQGQQTSKGLQAAGCESLRAIATALKERGIPTARGGKCSSVQVARLLEAASPFGISAALAIG